jgi:hypothetical protein
MTDVEVGSINCPWTRHEEILGGCIVNFGT